MKKEAILFILLSPLIYLYGLAENHFSFSNSIRGYTLEFGYEYINAWRVLFGKEYKNKSVEVALYEYKLKAKKAKFDLDIALKMKKLYGSWEIRFDKKKNKSVEVALYEYKLKAKKTKFDLEIAMEMKKYMGHGILYPIRRKGN